MVPTRNSYGLRRICFLALDYPSESSGGGVGSQVYILAHAFSRAGWEIAVIDLSRSGNSTVEHDGPVAVYRVKYGNIHWYISKLPFLGNILALPIRELEYAWAAFRQVRKLHRRETINLIEGSETGSIIAAYLLRSVPLVIRLHGERFTFAKHTPPFRIGIDVRLTRWLQRLAMQRARLLIAPSRTHKREIAAELGKRHPVIRVIPNSVDCQQMGVDSSHEKNPRLILYVGRLQKVKAIEVLLGAAPVVIEQFKDAKFVLAGSPHPSIPLEQIREQIELSGISTNIALVGHVERWRLQSLYEQAAMVVIPSFYESFGLVALEAMCHRVPVIASRAGGLVDIVEDESTGLLIPPGDSKALAGAVIRLLEDPALGGLMGSNGYARVMEHFSVERLVTENLNAYVQAWPGTVGVN